MAILAAAAPSVRAPTIAAFKAFQAALVTFGNTNGLNSDAGTTNPLYPVYAQLTNLGAIQLDVLSSNQSAQQVTVMGGSFYDIAAEYYGDATQAYAIMYANGFYTPWIAYGQVLTVNLPPAQTLTPAYGVAAPQVTP